MVLGKFERRCGLLLADIFPDYAAPHQVLGFFKGIGFFVIDLFDVNRRQPLLFADALHQFQRPAELAVGPHLVLKRRVRIALLVADVSAVVNRILQACRVQRQIQFQIVAADVDFRNRCFAVRKAVGVPADPRLRALVGQERVFQLAVEMFDMRAGLNQAPFKALAIMRNDIAAGLLVVADDPLVSAETVGIVCIVDKILVILAVVPRGFFRAFVLVILCRSGHDCAHRHAAVRLFSGFCRFRRRCSRALGVLLCRSLCLLLTDQRLNQRFQQLLGFGRSALRRSGGRLHRRGGLRLAYRLGHGLFHVDELALPFRRPAGCRCGLAADRRHAACRRCGFFRLRLSGFRLVGADLRLLCHCSLAFGFCPGAFLFPSALLFLKLPSCLFGCLSAHTLVAFRFSSAFRCTLGCRALGFFFLPACAFLGFALQALFLLAVQVCGHEIKARNTRRNQKDCQHRRAGNRQNQQDPQHAFRRKRAKHCLARKQHGKGTVIVVSVTVLSVSPFLRLDHAPNQHADADHLKRENQRCRRNGEIDPALPVAKQTGEPHTNR